jgi:uncharacterized protein (DUF983 family)
MEHRPVIWAVVTRGWQKRCPHCGQAPIFKGWVTAHERCVVCGLVFHRKQGDTWFFWIVTDRIPLLFGIAAVYFGFRVTHWIIGILFLLALVVPLVATIPRRQGVAIALAYLSRVYWRDASDHIPEPWPDGGKSSSAARSGT